MFNPKVAKYIDNLKFEDYSKVIDVVLEIEDQSKITIKDVQDILGNKRVFASLNHN